MSQIWGAQRLQFSRREAAALLNISERSLDYAIARGHIACIRYGRRVLVNRDEILRFAHHDVAELRPQH